MGSDSSPVRILEAARRLFSEHGPDAVTVAEVAEAAGVARATVFNHFGSKRALIEGITEDVLLPYQAMLDAALADESTSTTVLVRALFEQMGRGIEEDRRFFRAAFREIARLVLGLDEGGPGERVRQGLVSRLLRLLARGQARGDLVGGHRPEDLAIAIDGLVFGTITHWLYDDASEPLHERMQRAAQVFLAPVSREPELELPGDFPALVQPEPEPKPASKTDVARRRTLPARRGAKRRVRT